MAFLRNRGRNRVLKQHPSIALNTARSCTGRPFCVWGGHSLVITLVIRDQRSSAEQVTVAITNHVNMERWASAEEPTCHYVMVEFNLAGGKASHHGRACGKALWKALKPARE